MIKIKEMKFHITRVEYFAHANCPVAVFFEVLWYCGVVASHFPPVRH